VTNDIDRPKYATPPRLDEAGLIGYLKTQPDVAAAYLFGSMATGKSNPQSDVDIAILLTRISRDPMEAVERHLDLIASVASFSDRETDVVILNEGDVLFRRQVLAYGRLLYEGERWARIEFEVQTGKEYADLKPMYDFFKQALLDEIEEVGLGGRRRHPIQTHGLPAQRA
jgi:predicted nucleotidyltransferase